MLQFFIYFEIFVPITAAGPHKHMLSIICCLYDHLLNYSLITFSTSKNSYMCSFALYYGELLSFALNHIRAFFYLFLSDFRMTVLIKAEFTLIFLKNRTLYFFAPLSEHIMHHLTLFICYAGINVRCGKKYDLIRDDMWLQLSVHTFQYCRYFHSRQP